MALPNRFAIGAPLSRIAMLGVLSQRNHEHFPNGKHKANLIYAGEMLFGPPPSIFRLEIDGEPVPNRIFGDRLCWSGDSRYLATEEWMTTDYPAGLSHGCCSSIREEASFHIQKNRKGFAR